jgi:ABC-type transport system involved in cytochrome c biogenesis permease subunit
MDTTSTGSRVIRERNIVLVYLFSIVTFGIYALYWSVSTKRDINSLGASIPTSWLLLVPIANIYWMYKYCEGFSQKVKKDDNAVLWFILYMVVGIIMPAIVQSELNKIAQSSKPQDAIIIA